MNELAGIIVTPKNLNVDKRMLKFCDYYGEGKPDAFCDGYAPVLIDKNGNLHMHNSFREGLELYCEALGSYRVRNVVNPYYDGSELSGEPYYPAGLSALVTPSGKVYFDEEVEEKLDEYCRRHPDWGICIINYHC